MTKPGQTRVLLYVFNMNIHQIAKERQLINETIRDFFKSRGFVEVETPLLVASPGMEPNLSPFETKVVEPNNQTHQAGLITSPEYSMKKLLGQGMKKVFTITKVFRNHEDLGNVHNPEFSMLEWYAQGQDYQACMNETEELVREVIKNVGKTPGGYPHLIDRVRVRDLFLKYAQIDLEKDDLTDHQKDNTDTISDVFYRIFLNEIEPHLENIFVYDYPKYQAALSRLTKDGKYGERFELYLGGLELCNGFTELTDPVEQSQRFEEEIQERRDLGKTLFPIDEELLALLPSIQNPTYGNALGIDRLHLIATNRSSINDVLLFPASKLFK
ncbi:EF-P lysine aminoacylase EpmA [Patescibacteria group bacterium]